MELRVDSLRCLTSALGIGDGYDEQLLRGIAGNCGGRLHDAEFTTEISSVLLGEFDDIFGAIVEDARIEATSPTGVRVEVACPIPIEPSNQLSVGNYAASPAHCM